jgi:hypothetical protein
LKCIAANVSVVLASSTWAYEGSGRYIIRRHKSIFSLTPPLQILAPIQEKRSFLDLTTVEGFQRDPRATHTLIVGVDIR